MNPTTAVLPIESGATTISLPDEFPSIFRLYSVSVIDIVDNSGTISTSTESITVASHTNRQITLSAATSGSGLAIIVYEPELTLASML